LPWAMTMLAITHAFSCEKKSRGRGFHQCVFLGEQMLQGPFEVEATSSERNLGDRALDSCAEPYDRKPRWFNKKWLQEFRRDHKTGKNWEKKWKKNWKTAGWKKLSNKCKVAPGQGKDNCNSPNKKMECKTTVPGSKAMMCIDCHRECGHRLVPKMWTAGSLQFPKDVKGICRDVGARHECSQRIACYTPAGQKAQLDSTEYICSRYCQPYFPIKLPATKAVYKGKDGRSAVFCNFFKRVHCNAHTYQECKKANVNKIIYSTAQERTANSTHANCGPSIACSVKKEVTCAKVCKLTETGEPDYKKCSINACLPSYCTLMGMMG